MAYRLHKIVRSDLPSDTFILCSKQTQDVLFRPHSAGEKLYRLMEDAGTVLVKAVAEKALQGVERDKITELVYLAGGFYYGLGHGFREALGFTPRQCIIGMKRLLVPGTQGEYAVKATYRNFDALADGACVVIGDTIATGATLAKGLECLAEAFEEKKVKPKKIIVCSLACSVDGARKLKEMEVRLKKMWPSLGVCLVACGELFHLMPDGTDLRFLYDDAVIPEKTRQAVLREYGPLLGRTMKCAVFDWGTRFNNPSAHYQEFLKYAETELEGGELDTKGRAVLERMAREASKDLAALRGRVAQHKHAVMLARRQTL